VIALLAPALTVAVLYTPVLGLQLIGDDYQWLQLANAAGSRPGLLLADLDGFWRPSSTWLMVLEHRVWGPDPAGYHLTNLMLHAVAAMLLAAAGLRLGLSRVAASVVGVLWGASPFALEPAASVACRHENLLLIGWMVLVLVWPGSGERWSRGKIGAVLAGAALAMVSKETWVVTPALVAALELWHRDRGLVGAVRGAVPWCAAVGVYALVHVLVLPGRSYFAITPETLAKVPHQLAAFLALEQLAPLDFSFSWTGALALAVVVAVGVVAVRWRIRSASVGLVLLAAPVLPTLFIPYLPTRYTAIPYAGFLLLAAGVAGAWILRLQPRWQHAARSGLAMVVALVLVAGALTVRADLEDHRRVSAAHARLLGEARQVAGQMPRDQVVMAVRAETDNPLAEISLTPRGLAKIYYPRHCDPYALIDSAALWDWVLRDDGVVVRGVEAGPEPPAAVLVHRSGRFEWLAGDEAVGFLELERQEGSGVCVQWIRAEER
jgi:hypothetical protein